MTAFPPEPPPSDGSAHEDPDGVAPADTSHPADTSADDADELTDAAVTRLRALLQTEDSPVDPARRDAAIRAALVTGGVPVETSHHRDGLPRRVRRRPERRLLATAAAVLLVLAGAAAVLTDGWSSGSSTSDEDASGAGAEVTVDAEATEDAEDATLDYSDGDASQEDSAQARSSADDSSPATTTAGAATATESAPDLRAPVPQLGEYPDADTLLAAASSMTLAGSGLDDDFPTADCAAAWLSPDAETLATATVQGVPVIVLRSVDPTLTRRLAAVTTDCSVLAQR